MESSRTWPWPRGQQMVSLALAWGGKSLALVLASGVKSLALALASGKNSSFFGQL